MESQSTPPVQNFTPLSSLKHGSHVGKKAIALILGIAVLALSGFALLMMNLQQKGTLTGNAVEIVPECHTNGISPLGADPTCRENGSGAPAAWNDGGWKSCTAPAEGTCKMKGACFECRYQFAGLRTICPCVTTPTPIPTKPVVEKICGSPFQCLPPELCVPGSLVKPSSDTNTSVTDQTTVGGGTNTGPSGKDGFGVCANGQFCCIKKQPTPTPTLTPSPSPSQCPVPGAVEDIKITCPLCNKQP